MIDALRQLDPRCRVTTIPLASVLPKYGRKWFSGKKLVCTFCERKDHDVSFCPSKPYEPPPSGIIPFVEKVLAIPRVGSNCFSSLSLSEGSALIQKMGEEFNEGNPWKGSTLIYDQLRARLGFWRAIGASNAVISWLGYGVPMRFVQEPPYFAFPNHTCDEPEMSAYVAKDMKESIAAGYIIRAPPRSVRVSNPILCIKQGCKCRRCDDCRHCNSYQANSSFRMDSVKRDVPNMVLPGDIQITEELEKAYYKVPVAESARPYLGTFFEGLFYLAMVMLFGMCHTSRPLFRIVHCIVHDLPE